MTLPDSTFVVSAMDDREDRLRIAFIHPDLGIGGAERLVVDAALGLQQLGHEVDIYTSHHDPGHCFEETRDGTLRVHNIIPPFPRSYKGKFHILFAHLRQLHLTYHLLSTKSQTNHASTYDVFFVDQLSTCIPFLRAFAKRRVVFYVHFPDKLLADGEFVAGKVRRRKGGFLKKVYRMPMDWLEEVTTGSADVLLANSHFTVEVFNTFFRIPRKPRVVYPGINFAAYAPPADMDLPEIKEISSDRPTLLSLNRFEKKKNIALALKAFANLRQDEDVKQKRLRLVLAGGFDPRLRDNIDAMEELIEITLKSGLSYYISTPVSSFALPFPRSSSSSVSELGLSSSAQFAPPETETETETDVLFLLNFTTPQRAALLNSPSTLALLYTPANEHFGIGPVEAMACGLPVLACDSGGPTESVLSEDDDDDVIAVRTGWLCPPREKEWTDALKEIMSLSPASRLALGQRAKTRAQELFGMEAMARGIEEALFDAVHLGRVGGSWSCLRDVLLAVVISLLALAIYRLIVQVVVQLWYSS